MAETITKICSRCKHINKCYKSTGWCKSCQTQYYRKKNNVKSPRLDISDKERCCQRCLVVKSIDEFKSNKNCRLGRERTCKTCYNLRNKNPDFKKNQQEYKREWHKKNAEYVRSKVIEWQKDNPEKVAEKQHRRRLLAIHNGNNNLTAEQIATLKALCTSCVICGKLEDLTLDHIKSLKSGGQNTITNLTVLCRSCNSSKGANGTIEVEETITIGDTCYVIGVAK